MTVAAILVGTVVGAGYASGRELWEFYAAYGPVGLFSSFATGLLIGFAGYRALSRSPDARSYASFSAGWPSSLALALDAVGTLFLVVTLAATIAAAAALASSIRGLGFTQGLLLFAFLIGLLSLRGVRSLAPVHGLLVPYIILFFITLLIKEGSLALPEREPSPALPFPFVWAAILYAAYNFLPALGALLALDPDLKIRGH
ncbi:MAG: hypothetical protein QJR00_04995, partial [Bacillota bacterium]|nr:hypothetical protein [Bacillota bacterium]